MSVCKHCRGDVKWVKTDRWYCQNPDGSDHWDLCSQRKLEHFQKHGKWFSQKKGTEEGLKLEMKDALPNKSGKGFKTVQMLHRATKLIVGSKYVPSGCDCGLPPWELCKPDCQWSIVANNEKICSTLHTRIE